MNSYLLLRKMSVQNANAIAGLTYGFPAITNFLGFVHALSRQLDPTLEVSLDGVAVISHKNIVHARQPKGWGDYVFALTRNPLTKEAKTAAINEEGRMHLQVSLLIPVEGWIAGDKKSEYELLQQLQYHIPRLRVAGGQIIEMPEIELLHSEQQQKQALQGLMPGFVLLDRSEYLAAHFTELQQQDPTATLFDAWCDYSKIQYQAVNVATPYDPAKTERQQAVWHYLPKPQPGYLVPMAVGYCAISPCYKAGEVANTRDIVTPVVFAEAAYSVAEWRSVHALNNIQDALWYYQYNEPWYLAKSEPFQPEIPPIDDDEEFIWPNLDDNSTVNP